MIEGKKARITSVGKHWAAWFSYGTIVTLEDIREEEKAIMVDYDGYGGYISPMENDMKAELLYGLTGDEAHVLHMLYPWMAECLSVKS